MPTTASENLKQSISNENAVQKYGHYAYAPDGLGDQILVNSLIPG